MVLMIKYDKTLDEDEDDDDDRRASKPNPILILNVSLVFYYSCFRNGERLYGCFSGRYMKGGVVRHGHRAFPTITPNLTPKTPN